MHKRLSMALLAQCAFLHHTEFARIRKAQRPCSQAPWREGTERLIERIEESTFSALQKFPMQRNREFWSHRIFGKEQGISRPSSKHDCRTCEGKWPPLGRMKFPKTTAYSADRHKLENDTWMMLVDSPLMGGDYFDVIISAASWR